MKTAQVWRIDVGHTFSVASPVSAYFRCFLPPARMQRVEYAGESLMFKNGLRSVLFYDKLAQMKARARGGATGVRTALEKTEDSLTGVHLLRFEVQFKRQVRRSLKESEVTAGRLSDERFYTKAVRRWERQYFDLKRTLPLRVQLNGGSTVKGLVNYLAAAQLATIGAEGILDWIKAEQATGRLTRVEAKRCRDRILQLTSLEEYGQPCLELEELDRKVRQVATLCR